MMTGEKRSFFNSVAPQWDAISKPNDAASRVAAFCRRALPSGSRLVLDVGSGTGLLAPSLLPLCPDSVRLVELDFAFAMLQLSGIKSADARVRRVCADALAAPFAPERFDAVLCFGILPHLGSADESLPPLWRLLRRGGAFAVGHLMGSEELNRTHREIGGPVAGDTLPPCDTLVRLLRRMGAVSLEAEDSAAGYYVAARKAP